MNLNDKITIRPETKNDIDIISEINTQAFGRPNEADIVNLMRDQKFLPISLVAEQRNNVVGHIAFTSLFVQKHPHPSRAMGLAPLAVLPSYQGMGIGALLVRFGLDACILEGADIVMVFGYTNYFSCFGFQPAGKYDLIFEKTGFDSEFLGMEIKKEMIDRYSGKVMFHPAFRSMMMV